MDLGNTNRLKVFVAVAEALSFSKAAERLLISQPSVSKRVKELEERLGVPLFQRKGGTVALTEAGHLLLRHAREVTRVVEQMENEMTEMRDGVAGHLKLGLIPAWEYLLALPLVTFTRAYGSVYVDLVFGSQPGIVDQLLEDSIQLGFVGHAPKDTELEAIPVVEAQLVLIAAPNHVLVGRPVVRATEVPQPLPFVLDLDRPDTYGTGARYLDSLGIKRTSVMNLTGIEVTKRLVRDGAGLGLLPRITVTDELASGELGEIHLEGPPCTWILHAVRKRSHPLSPAVRALLAHIARTVQPPCLIPASYR